MAEAGVNRNQPATYAQTAYRSDCIPVMPPPVQTQYENITPQFPRLPWGHYQYLAPTLSFERQLWYAKAQDELPDEDRGHPWDHQRLKENTGLLAWVITALLYGKLGFYLLIWVTSAVVLITPVAKLLAGNLHASDDWITLVVDAGIFVGIPLIGYAICAPLHLWVARLSEQNLRANPTGYYRSDGMVRIRRKDGVFEAPFYEFDPYVEKIPFRGSWDYRLLLQHRYEPVSIRAASGLIGNTGRFEDVVAFWDLLQRFMDTAEPLPDAPMFEPFRHLDPVTAEQDRKTGRNPRYWRDMSEEEWRQNHEPQEQQRLQMARTDGPCIISAKVQGRGMPISDVQENPDGGSLFRA